MLTQGCHNIVWFERKIKRKHGKESAENEEAREAAAMVNHFGLAKNLGRGVSSRELSILLAGVVSYTHLRQQKYNTKWSDTSL